MNEEEKKSIEILKERKRDLLGLTKSSFYSSDRKLYKERVEAIETILNLIDKQQKEIKKLKDELKEERDFNKSALETLKECVHKDKIKEKIEELKKYVNDFEEYWSKDPRQFKKEKCIDYYKLEALKELLRG